jgi:hypothetical protein
VTGNGKREKKKRQKKNRDGRGRLGGHDLKKRERHDMGIWSREENAGETENQKRDIDMGKYSHHLGNKFS